jgi:hypothetical protein
MRRKVGLFAVLAAAAAALLLVLLRGWGPWATSRVPEDSTSYSADALADYTPGDAAVVLSVDLRQLRAAPVVRGRLEEPLRRLMSRAEAELPWLTRVGIDPWEGIDRVRVVLPAGQPSRPLWLVHGRIDPDRFEVGPGQMSAHAEGGRRLYQYRDPFAGLIWLAPAGDTLVVSAERSRVTAALDHAAQPVPVTVRDPVLRELLRRVDRTRPVWLAAALPALGPARPENRALGLVLGPVLRGARAVEGGLSAGEDVKVEFAFRTASEAAAEQLHKDLQDIAVLAQEAPLLLGGDRDLVLLFQLLGASAAARSDATVTLRCRLGAEQLGP